MHTERIVWGQCQSKTHVSSGGGDEVQAVLFYIICNAKCQVQHLLQQHVQTQWDVNQQEVNTNILWEDTECCWPCSVFLCSPSCEGSLFLSANLWYLLQELREGTKSNEQSKSSLFRPSEYLNIIFMMDLYSQVPGPASTHSYLAVFRLVDCPCLPLRHHSEAFCDWATSGSTTVYLKEIRQLQQLAKQDTVCCFFVCFCAVLPCLRRLLIFLNIVPWHSLLSLCWRINSSSSGFRRSLSSLGRETQPKMLHHMILCLFLYFIFKET